MVFTAAQTTAFFEDENQMAIPHATMEQLVNEGISAVADLSEFDKESIKAIAYNLRWPLAGNPFVFGAKSQRRLIIVCDLVRYYEKVGRTLSAANVQWSVMKNFDTQWKALKLKKDKDEPETPKITKGLNVMKWGESFRDYLHRCVGVRMVPLVYVIREEADVPAECPPNATGQPHSDSAGSVEEELVSRATQTHPLFRNDNASVYYKMEEATRGTTYAASIKPYQRRKDGRGAFKAIIAQHAGDDKWNAEIAKQDTLLHTQRWRGNGSFTLERHCNNHRNAFVQMEAASTHVPYQLPNGHTRVGYLLDSIETSDAELQAAMASIRQDKSEDGLRSNFEAAVATLLPADPVAKKITKAGDKRRNAQISQVTFEGDASEIAALKIKSGKGPKTGVALRYHTFGEWQKLSHEERQEVIAWRKMSEGRKTIQAQRDKRSKQTVKANTKSIATVVEKTVEEKIQQAAKESEDDKKAEAYIMEVVSKMSGKSKTTPQQVSANSEQSSSFLRSILRRTQN